MRAQHPMSSFAWTIKLRHLFCPKSAPAIGFALCFTFAPVQAQEINFDIPRKSLSTSLQEFGNQANIQVLYNPSDLQGLVSNNVSGRYSPSQAIAELLKGTGLAYSLTDNALTVTSSDPSAMELGATTINSKILSTTTEGTGSYTTGATSAATGLRLSPRQTPQSVSVVTRQRIQDQNMVTLANVLANSPGIATSELDSERTIFSARGFAITDFQLDGISSSYKSQFAAGESEMDSIIYDRIEIVRGATGLLSGSGEPSASVNLVRKKADSKDFRGEAQISAGSWDNYRSTLDLSGPLTENGRVRGRLVGAYQDKKSFFDRYDRKSHIVYGVIDIDVTDATTLSLGAGYQKSNAEGLTYGGVPLWYSDGSRTNFSRSFTVAPKWNTEEFKISNTYVNLEHRFDNDWSVQLNLMRSRNKVDNARLFVWGWPDSETGLISDTPSRVRYPGDREQESMDAKLTGPFTLGGREHEAVFGLSYYDQKYAFQRVGAQTPWVSPLSVYDFAYVAEPAWNYEGALSSEENRTKQSAAYSAVRLSLADPLKLILGGRFTKNEREGSGYNKANPYEYEDNKFIPYTGLVYDLNENLSAYASYTSIFKNQDYRDRTGSWLEPVTGDAYETGLKGEFLDGRLNASVAIFKIKQDNLGQTDAGYVVPGTNSPAYKASSGATSKGIELELSGEVAHNWNAFFFATHYSAKDSKDENFNTQLPRNMVRLFTTYQLPGQWHQLTVGGGANWQSRIYYDDMGPNLETQEQPSYVLANLMARYQITPQLSAQLNINNLFDKEYQTAVNFFGQGVWGTPRNALASLNYTF